MSGYWKNVSKASGRERWLRVVWMRGRESEIYYYNIRHARSSSLSGAVDKHDDYEVDARSSSSCCYVECLSMWDLHRAISNQFWVPEIGVN